MATGFKYASPLYDPATPFYGGAGSSAEVPFPFPVSVAGRPYQIQWDHTVIGVWGAKFKRESLPMLRQQADNSNTPGEQSISPEQFWRRSQETWHYGSGQTHLDRNQSELRRFSTSKGIDCWTPWKLKLLNQTAQVRASTNSNINLAIAGSNLYVADGTSLVYINGTPSIWQSQTLPSAGAWNVFYGGGKFVAWQNNSAIVATSLDGITWTSGALPSTNFWSSMSYNGSVYVIVAANGGNTAAVATSSDGLTWTARTASSAQTWNSVTYGGGLFVAVAGGTTTAMTSPDGITWTSRTMPSASQWTAVTYGGGLFVAVSQSTAGATSTDGITWTARTMPSAVLWSAIAYSGTTFVAVANDPTTTYATSTNGTTWTSRILPSSDSWSSIAYGGGNFVVTSATSGTSLTSLDGISWNSISLPTSASGWNVASNGTLFVAVTDSSDAIAATLTLTYNFANVTGVSATASTSIDTDGNTVYIANGADGIYSTVSGTSTASSYATGNVSVVRFVKSRLMAAGGGKLWNVTGAGALGGGGLLLDLSARSFTWVDICGGQSQIYAAGYAGDKSLIYRTALVADGTTLAVPTVAGELPDGEIVRSINAYLGYVVIGSDLGVRFCSVNSDGSLTIGSLISTTSPVYCMEGQDRFIWYGMTNYDSTSTGLGRMDLTTFTSTLTPAYASDLMATAQGTVRSVVTLANKRVFSVDGVGVFYEVLNTPVTSGTLTTGLVGYGISDDKVAMFVDLKYADTNGTITAAISTNNSTYTTIGTSPLTGSTNLSETLPCGQLPAEEFNLTFTLAPTGTTSPTLNRWTLRSYPTPKRSGQWDIPIMLYSEINAADKDWAFDVTAEYAFLSGLFNTGNIVNLQVGNTNYQVVLYDFTWLPEQTTALNDGNQEGTFYAQFREIAG